MSTPFVLISSLRNLTPVSSTHNGLLFGQACCITKLNIFEINNIIGHSAVLTMADIWRSKKGGYCKHWMNTNAYPKGIFISKNSTLPHRQS